MPFFTPKEIIELKNKYGVECMDDFVTMEDKDREEFMK